jgi:hypothetical protein
LIDYSFTYCLRVPIFWWISNWPCRVSQSSSIQWLQRHFSVSTALDFSKYP